MYAASAGIPAVSSTSAGTSRYTAVYRRVTAAVMALRFEAAARGNTATVPSWRGVSLGATRVGGGGVGGLTSWPRSWHWYVIHNVVTSSCFLWESLGLPLNYECRMVFIVRLHLLLHISVRARTNESWTKFVFIGSILCTYMFIYMCISIQQAQSCYRYAFSSFLVNAKALINIVWRKLINKLSTGNKCVCMRYVLRNISC